MTSDSRKSSKSQASSLPEIDLGREAERLESLAALLDGDLDGNLKKGRRAEILASLDGGDLDLLSEVDALADEIAEVSFDDEGAVEIQDALPDNVVRGPWRRRAWAMATTLAAVLALAVLAPRLFLPEPPTPQMVVGALDTSTLSGESIPVLPWSPNRGGPGGGAIRDDALSPRDSFRLGVLATDLEAAARSGREGDMKTLGAWFEQVTGDSVLGLTYSSITASPPEVALAEHNAIQESISRLVDPFFYRYGLWVRAAWIAAEAGELEFFEGASARSLGALEPPDEEMEEEIRSLRQRVRGLHSGADLPGLAGELAAIADRRADRR